MAYRTRKHGRKARRGGTRRYRGGAEEIEEVITAKILGT
jgi:hypothetical protein